MRVLPKAPQNFPLELDDQCESVICLPRSLYIIRLAYLVLEEMKRACGLTWASVCLVLLGSPNSPGDCPLYENEKDEEVLRCFVQTGRRVFFEMAINKIVKY